MFINAIVATNVDRGFDYESDQPLAKGQVITVDFRGKSIQAIVASANITSDIPLNKIKKIKQSYALYFPESLYEFLLAFASYNITNIGKVITMALGAHIKDVIGYCEKNNIDSSKFNQNITGNIVDIELSEAQEATWNDINNYLINGNQFHSCVLHGVTGSGKTHVLFKAIQRLIAQGKSIMIMVPEISLCQQMLQLFHDCFGFQPILWHSGLTSAQRRNAWLNVVNSNQSVVLGTRSCLFLPINNLGLVIVDEEHDTSYKQEDQVIYNARDMAVMRAKYAQAKIILSSATPTIETLNNVDNNKYSIAKLFQRYDGALMPKISLVDMRKYNNKLCIAPPMIDAIKQQLADGKQVMLYINRRGYAPVNICKSCGASVDCPYCSVQLVEHKKHNILMCHYCGHNQCLSSDCTSCKQANSIITKGLGIERAFDEIKKYFPQAEIKIFSSDLFSTSKQLNESIKEIYDGKIDIILGTQMLAKGHNFPKLSMVGIIDGDALGQAFDMRCCEKNYHLLQQVSGRAGRTKDNIGQVLIQTYKPDSMLIAYLINNDFTGFVENEKRIRQIVQMPPFGRLIAFIISHHEQEIAMNHAQSLKIMLSKHLQELIKDLKILGPVEAPINMIRGKYRMRILLKHNNKNIGQIHNVIFQCVNAFKNQRNLNIKIDVDPYSFY